MERNQKTLIRLKNKEDLFTCCLQETHFGRKYTQRLKWGSGKRYFMQIEMTKKLRW